MLINWKWFDFRRLVLSISMGLVATILIVGGSLLAWFNLPEELFDAARSETLESAARAALALPAVLATAPLIQWWYSVIARVLSVPLIDGGGHESKV